MTSIARGNITVRYLTRGVGNQSKEEFFFSLSYLSDWPIEMGGSLTPKMIEALADLISTSDMQKIALGFLGFEHEKVESLKEDLTASEFRMKIFVVWKNREQPANEVEVSFSAVAKKEWMTTMDANWWPKERKVFWGVCQGCWDMPIYSPEARPLYQSNQEMIGLSLDKKNWRAKATVETSDPKLASRGFCTPMQAAKSRYEDAGVYAANWTSRCRTFPSLQELYRLLYRAGTKRGLVDLNKVTEILGVKLVETSPAASGTNQSVPASGSSSVPNMEVVPKVRPFPLENASQGPGHPTHLFGFLREATGKAVTRFSTLHKFSTRLTFALASWLRNLVRKDSHQKRHVIATTALMWPLFSPVNQYFWLISINVDDPSDFRNFLVGLKCLCFLRVHVDGEIEKSQK